LNSLIERSDRGRRFMPIAVFGHTDIGRVRETNEDDYLCLELGLRREGTGPSLYLAAVADGIGGHAGGEIASALAIQTLRDRFIGSSDGSVSGTDHIEVLKACLEEINSRVYARASQDEQFVGMGSTMVAALVQEKRAVIANVGDCRAYRFRDGQWLRITRDHNWHEEQLQKGELTESEILQSPLRNLVTRSLGFEPKVEVDAFEVDVRPGDFLLLCSDGLYKSLTERQVAKILKGKKNLEEKCRRLIRTACRKSGRDNITAVVLHIQGGGTKPEEKRSLSDTVRIAGPRHRKES
jgi:serine/threonine protein phosphatase PrpC